MRRIKEKNAGKSEEVDWQAQVKILEKLIEAHRRKLEELRSEIYRSESVLAEIERDIEKIEIVEEEP